ncbi:MAG: response regulator [Chloroflexota bacterium]
MFAYMADNKKILIVEDDVAISGLLETVVEAEGYQAVPAYDGETAIHMAHREHPDLITLDLALPCKDGPTVLRDLVAGLDTRDIPVIVVSAYTNYLSRDDLKQVAYVVGKPFDVEDLVGKMRHVLDTRQSSRPS